MVTCVVVGAIADKLGAAVQTVTVAANHPGRNFDVETRFSSVPSTEYRSVQPPRIVCDLNHDQPLGEVKFLERNDMRLHAVCEIDGSMLGHGPWYFSPLIRHIGGRDIELRGLAVTKRPASVALGQISAFPGSLPDAARKIVYQDGHAGQLVKRAAQYDQRRKYRYGEPLVIQGVHPQKPAPLPELTLSSRHVEIRSAAAVDVHRARRELDVLIAPAESPTVINEPGRRYVETFAHGCFAGCEAEPGRVKVNLYHRREQLIGRATHLDPWAEAGCTGTLRLARTARADEALALIDDDLLGVSAGFSIAANGDEWQGREHRRVKRATLHHVALVDEAAYQTARVTAVRALA